MAGNFEESLVHYGTANAIFQEIGDRFGQAYSFCGIGNAHRMMEHFGDALEYFRRAEELYRDIGDEVSYAWTLWSFGTALKVLQDWKGAEGKLQEAWELFTKTRDTRGMVYHFLALSEIRVFEGRREEACSLLEEAERLLVGKPFQLERIHLELYRWLILGGDGTVLEDIRRSYRKLGANFLPISPKLPLNLP